jgi:hypothetical protein
MKKHTRFFPKVERSCSDKAICSSSLGSIFGFFWGEHIVRLNGLHRGDAKL